MLLRLDGLEVHYGRLPAVRNLSLEVNQGELVCLVGPNGAGKSTTLLSVAGLVPQFKGSIIFDERDISSLPPEHRVGLGISLVPEGRHIFGSLTIEENLRIGATPRRDKSGIRNDLQRLLDQFPFFRNRLGTPAGKLSGGEQQQLAIGRALMNRPRLLLIDEPALGLAPRIIDQVYEILLSLRRLEQLTLIIVEQSTERALAIADRLYVMRSGEVQLHGRPTDLSAGLQLEEAYFGFRLHQHTAQTSSTGDD